MHIHKWGRFGHRRMQTHVHGFIPSQAEDKYRKYLQRQNHKHDPTLSLSPH